MGQDFSFRDFFQEVMRTTGRPEIAKPFNPADLQRVVQEVLGREE